MNMSAKYSGGPKAKAKFARIGRKKVSPTRLNVPATKDETAEMAKGRSRPPLLGHFIAIQRRRNG